MKLQTPLQIYNDVPPAQVLSCCAKCKSKDVFEFDGDLFCNPCGWNSIDSRVENQFAILAATNRKERARVPVKATTPIEKSTSVVISRAENTIEANVA